ncbi:thioredoxin family protein [Orientia tsutsugamushi str. Gilliam]|uniref:Conjugal transfer protein n=1 Tax=Orientia tsutsugamushi str. Gilliam TaxID=1359184 RepID=A0A0F3MFY2_ORITS|nr:conjugal transfer protein TraF [Orientia tsutsugamushi]KJV53484.1 thioredoxin family protein [Orientia tsutsugamushi str. Gilliam]SPR11113.1 conjugal transfer protein [Orientia tsutsugamushi str. Gilliam]
MMKRLSLILLFPVSCILFTDICCANSCNITDDTISTTVNANNISTEQKISNLAQRYSLILVTDPRCRYCQSFKPTFYQFVEKYKFKNDVIQISMSNITQTYRRLINKIKAVPTVILLDQSGDQSTIFSQGNVSLQYLEQVAIQTCEKISQKINSEDL